MNREQRLRDTARLRGLSLPSLEQHARHHFRMWGWPCHLPSQHSLYYVRMMVGLSSATEAEDDKFVKKEQVCTAHDRHQLVHLLKCLPLLDARLGWIFVGGGCPAWILRVRYHPNRVSASPPSEQQGRERGHGSWPIPTYTTWSILRVRGPC